MSQLSHHHHHHHFFPAKAKIKRGKGRGGGYLNLHSRIMYCTILYLSHIFYSTQFISPSKIILKYSSFNVWSLISSPPFFDFIIGQSQHFQFVHFDPTSILVLLVFLIFRRKGRRINDECMDGILLSKNEFSSDIKHKIRKENNWWRERISSCWEWMDGYMKRRI